MRELTIDETSRVTGGAATVGFDQSSDGTTNDGDANYEKKKSRKESPTQTPEPDTNPLPIG